MCISGQNPEIRPHPLGRTVPDAPDGELQIRQRVPPPRSRGQRLRWVTITIDTAGPLPPAAGACFLSDGMAVSFDYWRAMQRLRTSAEPTPPARTSRATARRRAEAGRQGRSWRLPALYLLALAAPALTALALSPAPPPAEAPIQREALLPERDSPRRADAEPARPKGGEAAIPQNCASGRRTADAARLAGAGLLAQAAAPCERAATER